ncbi:MAG: hypothetical protein K8R86_12220 [Bacteroidales bacterium]|nr:hypothetical protein [Bacteroidales bacterium]
MKKNYISLLCLVFMVFQLNIHGQSNIDYTQPVESGFFFLNGKYVEAPYIFEVNNLAIYINGLQLDKQIQYPIFDNRVFEDPGIPKGLSQNLTLVAIDSIRTDEGDIWILRRLRYFVQNYPEEESYVMCVDFLRSLPFIKSVEKYKDSLGTIELIDYKGNSKLLWISPHEYSPPPTLEELEQALERQKIRLIDRLIKGECKFYFSNQGEMSISRIKAAKILPDVLQTLESAELNSETKKELLDEYGLVQMNNSRNQILIDNYIRNTQLHYRLEQLRIKLIEEYGETY